MEILHWETKIIGSGHSLEVEVRCGSTKLRSKSIDTSSVENIYEAIANHVALLVKKILKERSDKFETIT
jgi:hypothetical protein